jgi:hypothetical protein
VLPALAFRAAREHGHFGDTAMIDLLLKSGARTGARAKEGLTALDLTRKYKHTHLSASLEKPIAAR